MKKETGIKLRRLIERLIKEESSRFKAGDKLKFKPSNYKELDYLRKSGTGMEAMYGAVDYPNEQIYIFRNYDGSTAVVYPEGDRNNLFRVHKDRFEVA
jgi:hypothetical protein